MYYCQAVSKKTGRVCALPIGSTGRVVNGVPLCMKHYLQWANGKTIKTKIGGASRRIRK
jgi:hypothetical protein